MKVTNFSTLIGKKFNKLTVLSLAKSKIDSQGYNRARLICQCECGSIKEYSATLVNCGDSKSCGCVRKEKLLQTIKDFKITHNLTRKIPEYISWANMRNRCNNPNCIRYKRYGERGIKVCERWNDFTLFLQDMGYRPTPKHTIERINNDGDYCPENCRWATHREQSINKCNVIIYEFNGDKGDLKFFSEKYNIDYDALRRRLFRSSIKLTFEQALTWEWKNKKWQPKQIIN